MVDFYVNGYEGERRIFLAATRDGPSSAIITATILRSIP